MSVDEIHTRLRQWREARWCLLWVKEGILWARHDRWGSLGQRISTSETKGAALLRVMTWNIHLSGHDAASIAQ
jgi:hypothetical protein